MIQTHKHNTQHINYTAITARGYHKQNQDAYTITPLEKHLFFAIADGLGSTPNAEQASRNAINQFNTQLKTTHHLTDITHHINTTLLKQKEEQQTPATTIVACLLNTETNQAIILHLGDSRAYVFNKTSWKTSDHTLVQELVDMNIITPKQAQTHAERHRLTSALGIHKHITPAVTKKNLNNTTLVLSSDGLHDYVSTEEIKHIVTTDIPETACLTLLNKAQQNGSTDDITIIIATINL